jgi:hypothetical protein
MKPERRKDEDSALFSGCLAFGACSIGLFLLSFWPFLLYVNSNQTEVLWKALAIGLIPLFIGGILVTRLFGTAGMGSFLAATMTFAVFFFLRHRLFPPQEMGDRYSLEYPTSFTWGIPLVAVGMAFLLVILFPPKKV